MTNKQQRSDQCNGAWWVGVPVRWLNSGDSRHRWAWQERDRDSRWTVAERFERWRSAP